MPEPLDLESIQIEGISLAEHRDSNQVIFNLFSDVNGKPFTTTSQIYIDRMNSVFEAGHLLAQERFSDDIEFGKEFGIELSHKIEGLKSNVMQKLSEKDPGDKEQHQEAVNLLAETTQKIAILLKKAESLYQSSNATELEDDWVAVLKKREYRKISEKRREKIINIYPDGVGGYVISYAKPITTISSLSRGGEPPELPNFWKSVSVHIGPDGQELSRRTLFRSASLTPTEEKDKKRRLEKAREIARFEMGEYAIDRLKEKISDLENIPEEEKASFLQSCFTFDFLDISLQSSIFVETKSVVESASVYDEISKEPEGLQLTEKHKKIVDDLLRENGVQLEEYRLKPNVVFFNLGCNTIRGNDFKGIQGKLNKKAKVEIQKKVYDSLSNGAELFEIKQILREKNPINNRRIKKIRKKINELNLKENDKKTLELFINFSEFNKRKQSLSIFSHSKNNSENNYLRQESVMALAEQLGFFVKANCQSGKDRTGLLFAMTEATQTYRDYNQQQIIKDKKTIWRDLLPVATAHTSGRVIVDVNCPGAKGFQGQTYNFITPKGFRESIDAVRQHRASKLHKVPYKIKEKITNKITNKSKKEVKNADFHQNRSFISRRKKENKISEEKLKQTLNNASMMVSLINTDGHSKNKYNRENEDSQIFTSLFSKNKINDREFEQLKQSFQDTNWDVKKTRHSIEIFDGGNEKITFTKSPHSLDFKTDTNSPSSIGALCRAVSSFNDHSALTSTYEINMTSPCDWKTQLDIMHQNGLDVRKIASFKVDGMERIADAASLIAQLAAKTEPTKVISNKLKR